jgi:membrane protein DedA with SNARE-associated domain
MIEIVTTIVDIVNDMGYIGILILMFIESSFIPFPSEIIIIPAGYLAYKQEMNLYLVILYGSIGSLFGALFNYFLAKKYGRLFLYKILKKEKVHSIEMFFNKYGNVSTFLARLLPGIRQYISLIAGIAKMNLKPFCIYTLLGSFIWVTILAYLGYLLGDNQLLIKQYLHEIIILILVIVSITAIYLYKKR